MSIPSRSLNWLGRLKVTAITSAEGWGRLTSAFAGTFRAVHKFCREHFLISDWRVEMSSRARLIDAHHSTLHAFFLAAKERGYTEFELQLVPIPKGRIEFCISPREHSEMSAKFEVRGNMVRAAASEASVVPADDTDVRINYGGTRSGEVPLRVSPGPEV
jgi:hypothetical protein